VRKLTFFQATKLAVVTTPVVAVSTVANLFTAGVSTLADTDLGREVATASDAGLKASWQLGEDFAYRLTDWGSETTAPISVVGSEPTL